MSRKSRYVTLFALAAMVVLFSGVYFTRSQNSAPPFPDMVLTETDDSTEPAGDETEVSSAGTTAQVEAMNSKQPSENAAGDSSTSKSSDPKPEAEPETVPEKDPTAKETISAILDSRDLEQAVVAQRTLRDCQFAPLTDRDLEHQLEHIKKTFGDMGPDWDMAEHLEGAIQRKFMLLNKCRGLATLRDQIWAGDLYERAVGGDEIARFIYAMWPPRQSEAFEMTTEEMMVYQSAAMEFTMQNLEEGHPLGLLAFGFAYSQSRIFTPGRSRLGIAYLIAAELCANGQFGLQAMLDEMLGAAEEHQYGSSPISTEDILATGTRLYDAHCAASITNSPP